MSPDIRVAIAEGVMTLTFARPQKRNALNDAMFGALADALEHAATADDVRTVLFTAEGAHFTAGNDLADLQRAPGQQTPATEPQVRRFGRNLIALEKPVVAAVKGHAAGIGATMLLHCDLIYIAGDARLSAPFVDIGLVPEMASTRLLTERIGYTRAFEFFTLHKPMSGATAAQWGVATEALPADSVDSAACMAARTLAGKSPEVLRATKRLMRRTETLRDQLAQEQALIIALKQSPQVQAAVRDFFDRKK